MQQHEIHCFSQRILNPFRGAMHTVRVRWAEAVTTDGREWTLYVQGECIHDDLEDGSHPGICVPDIKYGEWSSSRGLRRAPVRLPTFEQIISGHGQRLLQAVRQCEGQLPFPFSDHLEYWLLHGQTGKPLALLGSRCEHQPVEEPPSLHWTPGDAGMDAHPELIRLRQRVNELAGPDPAGRWFDRRRDNLPDGDLACDLPEISEFLEILRGWQSPATLLLPLTCEQRRATERLAARHALRLAEMLPLYPEVLEKKCITTALVEARMRQADPMAPDEENETLSPFYLEL